MLLVKYKSCLCVEKLPRLVICVTGQRTDTARSLKPAPSQLSPPPGAAAPSAAHSFPVPRASGHRKTPPTAGRPRLGAPRPYRCFRRRLRRPGPPRRQGAPGRAAGRGRPGACGGLGRRGARPWRVAVRCTVSGDR